MNSTTEGIPLTVTSGQSFYGNASTNTTASPLNVTMETRLFTTDDKTFFEHLDLRDETAFVALIVMGVFVPAVFIVMFLLIFFKRRKQVKERKAVMLLRNAQDLALEDYTCTLQRTV